MLNKLTPVLVSQDISCLCKQCRSRSVGFFRSQLIWICTVFHQVFEFIATFQIKQSDWLNIRSWCGLLIYSAWQGLRCHVHFKFSASQIIWSRLLTQLNTLNGKQCRSRSELASSCRSRAVGFWRSHLHFMQRQGISGFRGTRVNFSHKDLHQTMQMPKPICTFMHMPKWLTLVMLNKLLHHHIIIIGFLINVQVQGQHPHQWAPFQIAGLLHTWQISHQISRYVYH